MKMQLHEEILNEGQKTVLGKMDFIRDTDLYIGGGTALAMQLGHRTSVDFNLYCPKKFDVSATREMFKEHISGIEIISEHSDGTLQMSADGVEISVFYYPYKLISELVDFRPIKLAGLKDIAASKLAAIVQRARRRDFVDIYFLGKTLGFEQVVDCAYQKFPWYRESSGIIFTALSYSEEADNDDEADRVKLTGEDVTWEEIKDYIRNQVSQL